MILLGDCREILPTLDAGSVRCCVTSPPYWGLRDYGCEGQLGLEKTPEEYVAALVGVFREVRRVLAEDGTLWLNLGDCYANDTKWGGSTGGKHVAALHGQTGIGRQKVTTGLKAKDLVGIPWAVATALRAPYYTGRIARERDRVWLAAMIDAEGTICGFDHDRADGDGHRSGLHLAITNTSTALLDEATRIWPASRSRHQRPHAGHLGTMDSWRWIVHGIENKMAAVRELYPYLIAKRRQALVGYTLLALMADAKRLGHSSQKDAVLAKRRVLTGLLSDLNHQRPVTLPEWLVEPPDLYEPGFYLRSEIIWKKPNPMPESVTDRPTKAHEQVFLLSKRERYFYDAAAIAEHATHANEAAFDPGTDGLGGDDRRTGASTRRFGANPSTRNARTVWTIPTQPTPDAHFATFPEALAERCILAGSAQGNLVLDPFFGSGTVGKVAERFGRRWTGIELNPAYVGISERKTAQRGIFV